MLTMKTNGKCVLWFSLFYDTEFMLLSLSICVQFQVQFPWSVVKISVSSILVPVFPCSFVYPAWFLLWKAPKGLWHWCFFTLSGFHLQLLVTSWGHWHLCAHSGFHLRILYRTSMKGLVPLPEFHADYCGQIWQTHSQPVSSWACFFSQRSLLFSELGWWGGHQQEESVLELSCNCRWNIDSEWGLGDLGHKGRWFGPFLVVCS